MINEIPVVQMTAEVTSDEFGRTLLSSEFHGQEYHELSEHPVVTLNVLEQLKSNLNQLDDLHARMKFMMAELSYLLRK